MDFTADGWQWTPWLPLNIAENEKAFVVALEAPGMDQKDINVQLIGNQLLSPARRGGSNRRRRRRSGARLSASTGRSSARHAAVECSQRSDRYKKGVLILPLPKVEPTPSTNIKIKAE